ncbi:hypothetical protein ACFSE1_13790 [Rhizobium helianthi]|uniref:Uncharacterized protein n=1 Tax=Rhizobium helianthi TaxID=1132695 RepID=A0ABW4M5S6_9HYPH
MPSPYIAKKVWPDYILNGATFSFTHLAEAYFTAHDSLGHEKQIIVTYQDHVFTRDAVEGETLKDAFPGANRDPFGVFCPVRYRWSLRLPQIIALLPEQRIWNLRKDDRYAHVPVVAENGETILYSIVFSIEPVKRNIAYDFWIRVRTAYPCDGPPPDTFGDVRFSHLLMVRERGKHPPRNYSPHRKTPKTAASQSSDPTEE